MENSIYSNLGNRINKTFRDKRDTENLTIKDFIENKWSIANKSEFKEVFIREIKVLLNKENLFDLIQAFFELETNVQIAVEKLMLDEELSFDEFYRNLSPVLMRSLLEVAPYSNNNEMILNSIKESIRISLESEIFHLGDL
jgi:hypothetical protein